MSDVVECIQEMGMEHPTFNAMCYRVFKREYFSPTLVATHKVSEMIHTLLSGSASLEGNVIQLQNNDIINLTDRDVWILREICSYFSCGLLKKSGNVWYREKALYCKVSPDRFYHLLDSDQQMRVYSYMVLCRTIMSNVSPPWIMSSGTITRIERHQCAYICGQVGNMKVLNSLQDAYGDKVLKSAARGNREARDGYYTISTYLNSGEEEEKGYSLMDKILFVVVFLIYSFLMKL